MQGIAALHPRAIVARPRPGELGAAVIAGHVDSVSGPGVFFRLNLLRPRNLILVRRADHSLAVLCRLGADVREEKLPYRCGLRSGARR